MRARAAVTAEHVGGRTVLRELRSQPPLVLRQTHRGLMLVTGAAGPLGGDRTELDVLVGDGATLDVGSVAAAIAQPDAHGQESHAVVRLRVEDDATLRWRPEPLIVAVGSDHRSDLEVDLAPLARLVLTETIILGRYREEPGTLRSRWRIRRDGATLLAQDVTLGAGAPGGWDGPAVLAGARVMATALLIDPSLPSREAPLPVDGARTAVLALADPCAMLAVVLAPDALIAARALAALLAPAVPAIRKPGGATRN
jgi:urease accessory protein